MKSFFWEGWTYFLYNLFEIFFNRKVLFTYNFKDINEVISNLLNKQSHKIIKV